MGRNLTPADIQDIENVNDRINKLKDILISVLAGLQVELGHATVADMLDQLEEL